MLLYRYYFDKSLKRFFLPPTKPLVKLYLTSIGMTAIGCLLILWMVVNAFIFYHKPGPLVYIYIACFFINLYTTIKSVRDLCSLRVMLKNWMYLANVGKKIHSEYICVILESIKLHKNEKSKNRNNLQSDMENPS